MRTTDIRNDIICSASALESVSAPGSVCAPGSVSALGSVSLFIYLFIYS
jgi:hypothetical protein